MKLTKYKGYSILQVAPNAYRLFKNDLLVDQYQGTTKDAKLRIDTL
jgi:hypothetical protein